MTFVSLPFALLLTLTLALYWLLPTPRWRIPLLLVASYVFYAWWNPGYAGLILLSTTVDYVAGRYLEDKSRPGRRLAVGLSIAANLGLLAYFKYTNFGLAVLHELLGGTVAGLPRALDILLPVGISFYTFQSMGYTIDVYRGRIAAERHFPTFALFVAYFPQLVAGPIERAGDLLPQLRRQARWHSGLFEEGLRLLLMGFAKKLVIADRLAAVLAPFYSAPTYWSAPDLAFASLGMFTMLYFDFSAYTDMARGASALFGVRLSENFIRPMAATSIADFWRRWHITLSTWMRDYLYTPLGGFRPRRPGINIRNTLVTMGLVGLWHGANWTYLAWGLQHGVTMLLYQALLLGPLRRWKHHPWAQGRTMAMAGWTLTMILHALNMVWFFSPTPQHALAMFARLFSPAGWQGAWHPITGSGFLVLFALWAIHAAGARWDPLAAAARAAAPLRAAFMLLLVFGILILRVTESVTFVYFQF